MKFVSFDKKQINIFGFKYDTKSFGIVCGIYLGAILLLIGLNMFGIDVSWYGVMVVTAFLLAMVVTSHFCEYRDLSPEFPYDLIFWIFPFAIVGARLHYCICNFSMFEDNLIRILYVWDGGVAVHGGIFGGLIGLILCCVITKKKILNTTDAVAPALALGQSIGRIGCVFGECCYGQAVTNAMLQWVPLSIKVGDVWHFASNLHEGIFDFINFIILTIICRKSKTVGYPTFTYLAIYGFVRFFIEMTRDNSQIMRVFGMPVAQIISVVIFTIGVIGLVTLNVVNNKNKNKI